MNAKKESLPSETTELLRRILSAVEPAKARHGFEIPFAARQTVVFASEPRFGGIARAFDSRQLRSVPAARAVLLFLDIVLKPTTMPV